MNDNHGLLTLAAYLTATLLIVVVALLGVFHWGVSDRINSLPTVTNESQSEVAYGRVQMSSEAQAANAGSRFLADQRIRLLESLLTEKTQLLHEHMAKTASQEKELAELRGHLDSAVALAAEPLMTEDAGVVDRAEQPDTSEELSLEERASRLETEVLVAGATHDALIGQMESLQTELDRVFGELEMLRLTAEQASSQHLEELLALETGSAGVLLDLGSEAIAPLIKALEHADPVVRRWAATVLGGLGATAGDAVEPLAATLDDPDPRVRRAAKAALDLIER